MFAFLNDLARVRNIIIVQEVFICFLFVVRCVLVSLLRLGLLNYSFVCVVCAQIGNEQPFVTYIPAVFLNARFRRYLFLLPRSVICSFVICFVVAALDFGM